MYNLSHPTSEKWAGIATGYGLDGPGIESWWRRDIPHLSRQALGPTQPPVQWLPGLSRGVKSGRGVKLTPHPLIVPRSRKSRAIPLLPLWAVRPVQSLSACKRVHFFLLMKRVMCQVTPQKNNIHLALSYYTSVRSPQNKGRG